MTVTLTDQVKRFLLVLTLCIVGIAVVAGFTIAIARAVDDAREFNNLPRAVPAAEWADTSEARLAATGEAWSTDSTIDDVELTGAQAMILARLDAIAAQLDAIHFAAHDNLREAETLDLVREVHAEILASR